MNILFISEDLAGSDLCYRLKKEGHDVRLFIGDKNYRQNLEGMVEKIDNWEEYLDWVGRDGLIVFDCAGYGEDQDKLREKGYSVVGGNAWSDKLENDRQYGQKIFASCGMRIVDSQHFNCAESAIAFVEKNPETWVVKQNGHVGKGFNYVGELESGVDVIAILSNYSKNNPQDCMSIDLQKRIYGVEIGIGRYFNGNNWVGPIEINVEHKNLCDGDLGPKTDEMGTLMWYEEDESIELYQKTLVRFEDYLRKISFKGDFEINCIINEDGIFPLEATPRFGCPSTQLQAEIHLSPWGEFLKAIADGKDYKLEYKKGFAIIVLLATPPFPYEVTAKKNYSDGITIFFKDKFNENSDMEHVHFEEVSKNEKGEYYISGKSGYVLHVSGMGGTISEARKKTYSIAKNIVIPKVFYRNDVGERFEKYEFNKIKEWIK